MPTQSELIGNHPEEPNIFAICLECNDIDVTPSKCHRSLTSSIQANYDDLIEWLANKLIYHHYDDNKIKKLQNKYAELGFDKYAKQHRRLPKTDRTKKGNATEIILIEYIESSLNKKLIHSYKLRYNPNVDQAMKGDDTLMIDFISENEIKVYLGEAKFRKTPNKSVIEDIVKSLEKDKLPLSYSFLVNMLEKDSETENLANILDEFIIDDIKGKSNLIYTGLLLSNTKTLDTVENHLNSDNPQMVLISIGIENPEELINKSFEKAEYLVNNPIEI